MEGGESSSSAKYWEWWAFQLWATQVFTEEEDNSENESSRSKRMSKLEQHLEALTNQDGLQDVG